MKHLPLVLVLAVFAYLAYFVQDVGQKVGTWPF